ncbi:MAG: 30S ribosomal protein S1 [Candidatus Omnitrophica bacterium]|nr:30S ribosomal protein S1 [Candidatus Omnitrophota bacterium]
MNNEEKINLQQLYNQTVKTIHEDEMIKGKIVSIRPKEVLVDVGFKSEGIIPINEFLPEELQIGKELDFFVESIENEVGAIVLSREKARHIQGWSKIVKQYEEGSLVDGIPYKKVKGGFMVSVSGIDGFLPASLSAFKGIPEKEILNRIFKFKIIKTNNLRRTLILSRKEAVQKEKQEAKEKIWQGLKIGQTVTGTVKAITDFGAFIDLGGVDGLLHIADMSWSKISHPSEIVALGDKIEVMILSIDRQQEKISLGLKQKLPDPWQDVEKKYAVGSKAKAKVVNITNYGIFVELEKGVEGLIHTSEISWTKRNIKPSEMFAIGDILEVQVLSIDKENRRISLSLKQLEPDPWQDVEQRFQVGTKVSGKVRGFTDYGAFVELDNNLEGLIHVSDMSWTRKVSHPQEVLKKGQKVEVIVLSVDPQNRRIGLGLKQLQPNPWPEIAQRYPLNTVLEAEVVSITEFGVFVKLEPDLEGLVYASEIDKELVARLKPKDKLKVKVIRVDIQQGKIGLSAKV